jgi:hypothetical protein
MHIYNMDFHMSHVIQISHRYYFNMPYVIWNLNVIKFISDYYLLS